ncbi:MAG TPA: hypothetical protein GX747_01605 [Tenericutes bacterium]|nr:hypothetical protein [Mycoplasmatota bacterium]
MVEKIFYEEVLKEVTTLNNLSINYNFKSDKREIYVDDTLKKVFENELSSFERNQKKQKSLNDDYEMEDFQLYSYFPTMVVKDEKIFNQKLNEHIAIVLKHFEDTDPKDIKIESKIKYYLIHLMGNATSYDFQNPIEYIDKVNNFFTDKSFEHLKETTECYIKTLGQNIKYSIIDNTGYKETPHSFISYITNNIDGVNVSYKLPRVLYGINEENGEKVAYIYTVQMKNEFIDTVYEVNKKYNKKINKLLYKINEGIDPNDDIIAVTHNAIYALTTFLAVAYNEGIRKFKVPPYLIVRNNRKMIDHELKSQYLLRMSDDVDTYDEIADDVKNLLRIQTNMIVKFIMNFMRLNHHFDNMNIKSFPTENDESCLIFNLEGLECNNSILSDICNTISEKYYEKENTKRM